jgi:hypothetical protein
VYRARRWNNKTGTMEATVYGTLPLKTRPNGTFVSRCLLGPVSVPNLPFVRRTAAKEKVGQPSVERRAHGQDDRKAVIMHIAADHQTNDHPRHEHNIHAPQPVYIGYAHKPRQGRDRASDDGRARHPSNDST